MNTNWLKLSFLIKGVNMVNKKLLLCICLLSTVLFMVTSCTLKEKEGSEQSNIENNIESSDDASKDNLEKTVLMTETDQDKDFYKRLILRLIRDQIAITEDEKRYFFSDTVSVDYDKMLPESKFYIVDINGDKKLDIGIRFPSNVLMTYYYNEETDTLSLALDYHMYTEILGNGQVMTFSQTAMSKNYFYSVIDILEENITTIGFLRDYNGKTVLSDGTEKIDYLYSIDVEMRLPGDSEYPNNISSETDVTKEQWDMMKKPFDDLRENAPKPFNYEELMEVES